MGGKLVRLTVALGLTGLVLYWSHPRHILAAAAGADVRWIAAALGLVLIDRSLMAMRWIDLLVALAPGTRPSLRVVLTIFFESSFVSNFVPSVASDMYRAYALSRCDVHLAESTASVLMDRALGVLSVVIVGGAAVPFASDIAERAQLSLWLGIIFVVCAVAAAVVFSERAAGRVRAMSALIPIAVLQR
ncbi:MAG: lysylphosphatidylglycerol synthase domain-containing protein, partial [Vicinamibacterales bacterium]